LAVSAGTEAAIAEQINSLGANLVIVSPMRGVPGAAKTLLVADYLAIKEQTAGIIGVSAEQSPAPQTIKANGETLDSIAIVGTTSDFPLVRDYQIEFGRYFSPDEDERGAKIAIPRKD